MDFDARSRNQPRTYTPPSTPTKRSHSKSSSVSSSSIREELENLRRGMSSGYSVEGIEKPGSHEPRQFPAWSSDYEFEMDAAGTQKVIGTGAWSTVYLASPAPSMPEELVISSSLASPEITPPLTPVRSRGSSMSKFYPLMPSAYAVKVPYEKTAHRVLTEEGRILSYLSRFPSAEKYLVPYYGQDMRTDALIMGYMPSTLDSLITADLNTRDESDRAAMLTDIFPHIACNLLDGLAWLQDKACIHGDIKPSNILIAVNPSTRTPHAVFADFSAASLPSSPAETGKKQAKPMGGATWDFMAPSQLTSTAAPTPEADVWSLAISLLLLVTGASPYDRVAPNAILKREILKQGTPLDYVSAGENGVRSVIRMGALSRGLGFNVKKWMGKVLVREEAARMDVGEWREELGDALM
ncbi:kinase-like protein [Paraphaeosphaeria sporulosa]|uniref:Kinase-like protein n=1 Tax=Paraphaeosphaeria sporulosa TaxID=1460663 RepID=A0A177CWA2_9PLEO|nr:kinase-like protein [Paraphaeosphaeria sporulosa]OAG11793.1 kinase-like protein [Paraphaeosphaeria sporulosa]